MSNTSPSPIRRFLVEHLRPYLPGTLLGALLIVASGSMQLLIMGCINLLFGGPLGMGNGKALRVPGVLQWILPNADASSAWTSSLFAVPGLIALFFFLRGVLGYAGSLLVGRSGLKIVKALKDRVFDSVVNQDMAFFQRHSAGQVMNRILSDVASVQSLASNQISDFLRQASTALYMTAYIIHLDWHFALVLLVFFPSIFLPIRHFSKKLRKQGRRSQGSSDVLLQRLKEVLANMRVVKAFASEPYESTRFHALSHGLYQQALRGMRIKLLTTPVMEIIGGLLLAGLATYGALRVKTGAMTGPEFLTLLMAIYGLYDPLRVLTRMMTDFQSSRLALERIFTQLDQQPVLLSPPHPAPVPEQPQILAFEQVRFGYGKTEVLKGIDLVVQRGETVALVGGSGGGKTTLVNLVPRFHDPTAGRITLDGTDLRAFDPRVLRQRIGIVTQETLLFMDTIHDNIAYGKKASRAEVEAAARKAHAHDFILGLPEGYDTRMSEAGSSLSGGQRQRIAIARALLLDPPILILDEATSALDTESERAVQAALETLMQDRTVLVIAHRLSTIQRATRICAMKHGRIVEAGTHATLLAQGGEYAKLHRMQFATGIPGE